jgi:methyltransferase family protein
MTFFSTRTGQFSYFSLQLGDAMWKYKDILDFGGNIGNILRDPNSNINEERYWCVDVAKEAIEKGRLSYPKAHWILYDRFSFAFNPYGIPELPLPDLGQPFDYILAFSVFTNTTQSDMLQLVSQLEQRLSDNGSFAFTFIDPGYVSSQDKCNETNFQWRMNLEVERGNVSEIEAKSIIERTQRADWFTLINGCDLYIESDDFRVYEPAQQKTCYAYHTARHMKKLFPNAQVLPPANDEMQHCCVIRKRAAPGQD